MRIGIIILILSMGINSNCKNKLNNKVCVYYGSGAVLSSDVAEALQKLNISHQFINEDDISKNKLNNCKILIIPGGYTTVIVNNLKKYYHLIRKFIKNGGCYIGICAGAYIAAPIVEVEGKPEGLGIINIKCEREAGLYLRKIKIVDKENLITKDIKENLKIWYQNGPMIIPKSKDIKIIAVYENNKGAIVTSNYGKGKVILFSSHPEGSSEYKINPVKLNTILLLKNAIFFLYPYK